MGLASESGVKRELPEEDRLFVFLGGRGGGVGWCLHARRTSPRGSRSYTGLLFLLCEVGLLLLTELPALAT